MANKWHQGCNSFFSSRCEELRIKNFCWVQDPNWTERRLRCDVDLETPSLISELNSALALLTQKCNCAIQLRNEWGCFQVQIPSQDHDMQLERPLPTTDVDVTRTLWSSTWHMHSECWRIKLWYGISNGYRWFIPCQSSHGNLISGWTSPPQPKTKSVGRIIWFY